MKRTAALAVVLAFYPAFVWAQYAPQYPPARTAASAPASPTTPTAAPAASPASAAADPTPLLTQIGQTSLATQQDLAALEIARWKTDASSKEQLQQQSAALRRNLSAALPELMAQVRAHPDDLTANFKLYRNLNALYDVLAPLADAAGRAGPQSDFESLAREATAFDRARRAFADRMETLAAARDAEILRLRTQAPPPAAPGSPRKIIIDDTKPVKRAAKKTPAKTAPPQ